ncbi:hypothetical protein NN561_001319 [Cricetulus griseus]
MPSSAQRPLRWGRIMSLLGSRLASEPSIQLSSKARMKNLPKKSQNDKYRLKYLRLYKVAMATVFENAICDETAHLEENFLKAKERRPCCRSPYGFKL